MARITAKMLLEHAFARLNRKDTWVQGAFARNRHHQVVSVTSTTARRFCAVGHLRRSAWELLGDDAMLDPPSSLRKAERLLLAAGPKVARVNDIKQLGGRVDGTDTEDLNDNLPPRRAKATTKRAYEYAIEQA